MEYRYNYLNNFLKAKFSERTLKICIEGGFTCPNRDGKKGIGGCIFCSSKGSGDHLKCKAITGQVEDYLKSERSKRANRYIAYFQSFTNTYGTIEELKKKYDAALIDDRIVALDIATRPDEITDEVVALLKSYTSNYYVWVELGLQTSNEETGKVINRCYTNVDFEEAVKKLKANGIDVVAHVMVGLPGETHEDIVNTIDFVNNQNIDGIKIHSTYVLKNTKLEELYRRGKYQVITYEEYMNELIFIITHLRKDIVIHRFSGDPPKESLIAPDWMNHKKWIMNGLNNRMAKENLEQGMYYESK